MPSCLAGLYVATDKVIQLNEYRFQNEVLTGEVRNRDHTCYNAFIITECLDSGVLCAGKLRPVVVAKVEGLCGN